VLTLTLLLAVPAALLIWAAWMFNRLIRLQNSSQGAWSDVDVQLKRRHDLVGNLVETVKGYARHERTTLEQVIRARTLAEDARNSGHPRYAGPAEEKLSGGVRQLFAVAEDYPDLKASDRFLDLQRALTEVENDLQNARRYYNAVVRDLNTRIQSFPDMLVSRTMGFEEREFFELEHPGEGRAPRVEMNS
jgi:LemA protein